MRNPLPALFAALLLVLPGCATSRELAPQGVGPALWAVKDADTTLYLFGTVHVLKPGTEWFGGTVKAAFDASDELVVEVVEPHQASMAKTVAGLALDPDGPPLSQKLDEKTRAAYIAAMEAQGMAWRMFEPFEPWMAGLMLAVAPLEKLGYSAEAGVEKTLTREAAAAGKPVSGLETVSQQLGYFDGLPEAQQVAFLKATVEGLPKAEQVFANLISAWAQGKPRELAGEMNASLDATPELAEVLLYRRNAEWAKWIARRMERPGTVFVAVGAGHLAGPKDVQSQLKALGFEARRVTAVH